MRKTLAGELLGVVATCITITVMIVAMIIVSLALAFVHYAF
jgi:hypothetical protein